MDLFELSTYIIKNVYNKFHFIYFQYIVLFN